LLSNEKACTGKFGIDNETKLYDQVPAHFMLSVPVIPFGKCKPFMAN